MRRIWQLCLFLTVVGLCWGTTSVAQEKAKEAAAPAAACAAPCLEKVCITAPDKKKTSKVVYSCSEKDVCLTKCPSLFGGKCDASCVDCGKPRVVRVLMKKTVTEECDSTKCVVAHREAAPKCAPACKTACPPPCTTVAPAAGAKTVAAPAQAAPQTSAPILNVEPAR